MYLYTFIKFLHILGIVIGFGGVIFTAILAARSMKDAQLFKISPKVISFFSLAIWGAWILLFATGIFLENFWELKNIDLEAKSSVLFVKKIIVLVIAFHGVYVNLYLARKMKYFASRDNPFEEPGFKKFKIMGMISTSFSLALWSSAVILGVWLTAGLTLNE